MNHPSSRTPSPAADGWDVCFTFCSGNINRDHMFNDRKIPDLRPSTLQIVSVKCSDIPLFALITSMLPAYVTLFDSGIIKVMGLGGLGSGWLML